MLSQEKLSRLHTSPTARDKPFTKVTSPSGSSTLLILKLYSYPAARSAPTMWLGRAALRLGFGCTPPGVILSNAEHSRTFGACPESTRRSRSGISGGVSLKMTRRVYTMSSFRINNVLQGMCEHGSPFHDKTNFVSILGGGTKMLAAVPMEPLEKHPYTVKNGGTVQKHSIIAYKKCVKSFERCRKTFLKVF